jgi:hypothetical protein
MNIPVAPIVFPPLAQLETVSMAAGRAVSENNKVLAKDVMDVAWEVITISQDLQSRYPTIVKKQKDCLLLLTTWAFLVSDCESVPLDNSADYLRSMYRVADKYQTALDGFLKWFREREDAVQTTRKRTRKSR